MKISRFVKAKAMGLAFIGLIVCGAPPAIAERPQEVQRMVIEEALNSRVPPSLALAVARVESNFQPGAVSPAGAKGVMQIMPKTARGVFGVGEEELMNARLNIQLGIDFLEQLYHQYGQRWDLALSHYNGGTLAGGQGAYAVPHGYTRKYVADVFRWERFYSTQPILRQVAGSRVNSGLTLAQSDIRVARDVAVAERPWRQPERRSVRRIDPIEFAEWADVERRRLAARRRLDDFGADEPANDG